MRWLRLQWFSISAGLKLWLDEPLGHLFNALVLAIALAMPWTIAQGLSAIVPSMDRWVGDPEISLYFKPDATLDSVKKCCRTIAARLRPRQCEYRHAGTGHGTLAHTKPNTRPG